MPDDVVIDGRPANREYAIGYDSGQQTERCRCLDIIQRVLQERPPSVPEALLRVGELIDAGD